MGCVDNSRRLLFKLYTAASLPLLLHVKFSADVCPKDNTGNFQALFSSNGQSNTFDEMPRTTFQPCCTVQYAVSRKVQVNKCYFSKDQETH